tara:strand:- start:298 stop:1905 length:1608 start_codon:yes stop_codon:yes gene_type:complete
MASESAETDSKNASSEPGAGSSASESVEEKDVAKAATPAEAATETSSPERTKGSTGASPDPSIQTDQSNPTGPDKSNEQLALPGMPEPEPEIDPHHDDPYHHNEYHDEYDDPYHHDYHEEHYHHDDPEHDDARYDGHHKDDHHNNYHYHDDHYDQSRSHRAYTAGSTAMAAQDRRPLDQRSFPENEEPELDLDEDGNPYGGPVKPFLDHLEDLRWTLLKCVFAMLISMMACMMGAKHLVGVLMWPLKQAESLGASKRTKIPLMIGQKNIGRLDIAALGEIGLDTNSPVFADKEGRFALEPRQIGTNTVLALAPRLPKPKTAFATGFDDIMVDLKNYGPFQSIWLCLQLALYGGLVIGAPFLIFFTAEFVLPALKVSEKKFLYKVAGIGSVLFLLGVAFCYFLIVQVALRASVEFSHWLGFMADEWNASEYLSFVVKFLLVMGVAFELPVVVLTVVKIGIIDYKQLAEWRSYCVVGMMVAAAVITPSGDPFTMLLVTIPLWILYEICVIIARIWYKQDEALEKAEKEAEARSDSAA